MASTPRGEGPTLPKTSKVSYLKIHRQCSRKNGGNEARSERRGRKTLNSISNIAGLSVVHCSCSLFRISQYHMMGSALSYRQSLRVYYSACTLQRLKYHVVGFRRYTLVFDGVAPNYPAHYLYIFLLSLCPVRERVHVCDISNATWDACAINIF